MLMKISDSYFPVIIDNMSMMNITSENYHPLNSEQEILFSVVYVVLNKSCFLKTKKKQC